MGVLQMGIGCAGFSLMHEDEQAFRFGTPAPEFVLKRNSAGVQWLHTARSGFVVQTMGLGR